MKKLKAIDIFNIISLLVILIADFCYMKINTSQYITKTIASGLFVLCGLINLIYILKNKEENSSFPLFKYFMMIGLVFASLGDIFLIDYFVIGVIFFALGHVFYFIAFLTIIKINWLDGVVGGVLFWGAALLILLYKKFEFNGMKGLILIYALIISLMTGKTISNLIRESSSKNILLVLGSVLFFLSDLMLLFRMFGGASIIVSDLCLIFYYPAQFILAFSVYYVSHNTAKIKEKTNESI